MTLPRPFPFRSRALPPRMLLRVAAAVPVLALSAPPAAAPVAPVVPVVPVAAGVAGVAAPVRAAAPAADCPPLLRHTLPRLQDEQPVDLCRYRGQVLLVVNTASYCGYTDQFQALEALAERWRPRGLTVLGFPSNDFHQEPGSGAQIAAFCRNTYGVRFPMFAKSQVRAERPGAATLNPLYADLARLSGQSPGWNFHKYLISRDGRQVLSFASAVTPEDPGLLKALQRLLAQSPD